jgi:ectoine hydroxylase-related dioxygenase (phytanoyl-CoA dioxygenase family)
LWPHHWLHDDPRIHAAECGAEHVDEAAAVAVPLAAGSCVAHDGRTLHSALPNVSVTDRLAYIVAFTAQPVLTREAYSVPLVSNSTANIRRRTHWLRHGGFLIYGMRRLRQGLRSSPSSLVLKLRLLVRAIGLRASTGR